jgi:hypothetical protein
VVSREKKSNQREARDTAIAALVGYRPYGAHISVTTSICYCARHMRRQRVNQKLTQSTCATISCSYNTLAEKAEKNESAPCGYRIIYEHLSTSTTLVFSVARHLTPHATGPALARRSRSPDPAPWCTRFLCWGEVQPTRMRGLQSPSRARSAATCPWSWMRTAPRRVNYACALVEVVRVPHKRGAVHAGVALFHSPPRM